VRPVNPAAKDSMPPYLSGNYGAQFPLFVTPFPQQKITRATSILLGREYYCFQRRRDLPEGESGLTDVFENRQRDSVQATGNGRV
jgi:hypothetical protein